MKQTKPTPFELASLAVMLSQRADAPGSTPSECFGVAASLWSSAVQFLEKGRQVPELWDISFREWVKPAGEDVRGKRAPTPSGFTNVKGLEKAMRTSLETIEDRDLRVVIAVALQTKEISQSDFRWWWESVTAPKSGNGRQVVRRARPTYKFRQPFPFPQDSTKRKQYEEK